MASSDCPEYKRLEGVLNGYRQEAKAYRDAPRINKMGQRKARQLALNATLKGNEALDLLTTHQRNCPICQQEL